MLWLLACSEPAPPVVAAPLTPTDLHIQAGLAKAPDFEVRVVGPWVVFGKGDLERRAGTVEWAHGLLVKDFFPVVPTEPVDVWLFPDAETYDAYVLAWFGEPPGTPYGFANDDGLFMNIATGGGTLVHEMVHPLMGTNFPECPPWYNEGLASLYEAVTEEDGHLRGRLNWRLDGLQSQIKGSNLPSFEALMAMDRDTFYHHDEADNYAQSRYLLYYLQEQDLLRPYHQAFTANVGRDPTGYATLKEVLKREDMAAFQAEWETWALSL